MWRGERLNWFRREGDDAAFAEVVRHDRRRIVRMGPEDAGFRIGRRKARILWTQAAAALT